MKTIEINTRADFDKLKDRFGIDTSKGCYAEFSERLREALPRLKQMQNWSPLELLIIESHEGKYK